MTSTVWLIYNDYDELMDVCATAEDCACHLVETEEVLLDDDVLAYNDEDGYQMYTTIRQAARDMNKSILDFMVDVLKHNNRTYWLPWHIELERVFGGYDRNLK